MNVSGPLAAQFESALEQQDWKKILVVIDNLQKEIFLLMESDSFPRFQKDPLYTRLENRLLKREFISNQVKFESFVTIYISKY